jgi:integrase
MAKRRRGNGEGSIFQRESDGLWCTTVDLGIVNGKRKRKTIYGKTRKEVADKLKRLLHEREQGINIAPERQTVQQFLERWLEQVIKPHRRARTYESYAQLTRLYLVPHIGGRQLSALTPEQAQAMFNHLLAEGSADGQPLTAQTVRHIRAVLRRALNQALKWNQVTRNVATLVELPRVERPPIAPLTPEQCAILLAALAGHRLEALYRIALSLGLRKGEVIGLRWKDVDLDAKLLRVTGAIQRQSGKLTRSAPKSQAGTRTLALPDVLVAVLHAHRERQAEERAVLGADWHEHDLVFPSNVGTPLEPRNLSRHFKLVLKKAGLPETTRFHDLRHSCATLLIAQGVHPRIVMEILGHSQISLTMNTYGHVLAESHREATTRVAGLFASLERPNEREPED